MKTVTYNINHFIIRVTIPEEIDIYKLQAQIPGIEYAKYELGIPHVKFEFIEDKLCKIIQDKNEVKLYGIWSNVFKTDIPHLLYGILRQYWIENGYYPLHSILLENSLLLGHSGSGKTSISLEALKHNIEVHSYDKTLVTFSNHNLQCISGTGVISVRKPLYEKNFSHHKDIIDNGDRVLILSDNKTLHDSINRIYLFFFADIPLTINKLSLTSSLHELYPYFLDTVKTDVIIGNGQTIFNGNNSTKSKELLTNHLNAWLLRNKAVEILIGRKEDIVQYVKNNNTKDSK